MSTAALIPLEEYLTTSYSPDCEYVDGALVERNVGEKPHSKLQRMVMFALCRKYPDVHIWPGLRLRTIRDRHRVPDVCVTLEEPLTDVLQEAPYLAIEILSPEDRMSRIIEKLEEYAAIGIPNIWVFDPRLRQMFTFRANALQLAGSIIATAGDPRLELTHAELFD